MSRTRKILEATWGSWTGPDIFNELKVGDLLRYKGSTPRSQAGHIYKVCYKTEIVCLCEPDDPFDGPTPSPVWVSTHSVALDLTAYEIDTQFEKVG